MYKDRWIKVAPDMPLNELPPEREWVEVTYKLTGQEPQVSVGYLETLAVKGGVQRAWTIFVPDWKSTRTFYFSTVTHWRERVPAKCPKTTERLG